MKTIHSHTETGARYPGYINISDMEDGRITVTIRARGGQVPSTVILDKDQLAALGADVSAFVAPVETPKASSKAKG